METESLRRVMQEIKQAARQMRHGKYSSRLAPKEEPPVGEEIIAIAEESPPKGLEEALGTDEAAPVEGEGEEMPLPLEGEESALPAEGEPDEAALAAEIKKLLARV